MRLRGAADRGGSPGTLPPLSRRLARTAAASPLLNHPCSTTPSCLLQVGRTFSFTRSASSTAKGSGQVPAQHGPGTEGDEAAGGGSAVSSATPSAAATPRGSEAGNESSAFYNPYKAAAAVLQQQLTSVQVRKQQNSPVLFQLFPCPAPLCRA